MGNLGNGSLVYAISNITGKIGAIREILDGGTPNHLETAQMDLENIKNILTANNKDELILKYLENQFNYWNSLTDEELYEI